MHTCPLAYVCVRSFYTMLLAQRGTLRMLSKDDRRCHKHDCQTQIEDRKSRSLYRLISTSMTFNIRPITSTRTRPSPPMDRPSLSYGAMRLSFGAEFSRPRNENLRSRRRVFTTFSRSSVRGTFRSVAEETTSAIIHSSLIPKERATARAAPRRPNALHVSFHCLRKR